LKSTNPVNRVEKTNLLWRPDFRAAEKGRVLIHHESRRFDVAAQSATSLKLAAFARENIALDSPSQFHRFCSDLTPDKSVLVDRERSGRIDRAFNLAVDHQFVPKLD